MKRKHKFYRRRRWTSAEIAQLRRLYPDTLTETIARRLKRPVCSVYGMAKLMGVRKNERYFSSDITGRFRKFSRAGAAFRFEKGRTPWNKGMKGFCVPGSEKGWFKPGQVSARWDPEIYAVGALRINSYGYVDMKIKDGSRSWRALHVILWEDAHGRVPPGHCLRFRDGDSLNVDLDNIELITRAENMRRNTIHNLPPQLRNTIALLGTLNRSIREKQDRRPA